MSKTNGRITIWLVTLAVAVLISTEAKTYENLGTRGLVAMPRNDGEVFLGWRFLQQDASSTGFNVYRTQTPGSGYTLLTLTPITTSTNFVDTDATVGSTYYYVVRAVNGGVEGPESNEASVMAETYGRKGTRIEIYAPLPEPYDPSNMSGCPQDAFHKIAVGDLNGDGLFDYVISWGSRKNPHWEGDRVTGYLDVDPPYDTFHVQAYLHDGTFLGWQHETNLTLELPNRNIVWNMPFLIYDLDSDGNAEVILKSNYDGANPHTSSNFKLVVLDGMTGAILAETPWHLGGHDRELSVISIAYLDGTNPNPSIILQEGTYTNDTTHAAYRFTGSELVQQWVHTGERTSHTIQIVDFDGDGNDEIVSGSSVLDEQGNLIWRYTNHHGDLSNVGDIDPTNPGLEAIFGVENSSIEPDAIVVFSLSNTPQILHTLTARDPGGKMVNIHPDSPGLELRWRSHGAWSESDPGYDPNAPRGGLATFESGSFSYLDSSPCGIGLVLEWDGDDTSKEFVRGLEADVVRIAKYHGDGSCPDIDWLYDTFGNNNMRSYVVADVLGDFRDEVICKGAAPASIVVFTNTDPIDTRKVTPLQDRYYRNRMLMYTVGYQYNQNGESLGIDIPQPAGQLSISGTITASGTDGEGLGRVQLSLTGTIDRQTATAPGGSYQFVGLGDGAYGITPAQAGYCFYPESIQIPAMTTSSSGNDFEGLWQLPVSAELTVATGKTYRFADLAPGARLYVDRQYTVATVPPAYSEDYALIRTAMEDKSFSGDPLLTLHAQEPTDVVVGVSNEAQTPDWLMSTWTDTGDIMVVDFGAQYGTRDFRLYRRTFAAGDIGLGPIETTYQMYTVLVRKTAECVCRDLDEDGYGDYCPAGPDCDDNDPGVHPGAAELCNGRDDDCDGEIDEIPGCQPQDPCPEGWIDLNGDQADGCEYECTATGEEQCGNGIDDDCDGQIDEGCDDLGDEGAAGGCGGCAAGTNASSPLVVLLWILISIAIRRRR